VKNIDFLKKLAKQMEKDDYEQNFILKLKNKKIVDIKIY